MPYASNSRLAWVISTPLGLPGGPGGVDERDHVVGLHGPPRRLEVEIRLRRGVQVVHARWCPRASRRCRRCARSAAPLARMRSTYCCLADRDLGAGVAEQVRRAARRAACCTPRTRWRRRVGRRSRAGRTRSGSPASATRCRRAGPRGPPARRRPCAPAPNTRARSTSGCRRASGSATASGSIDRGALERLAQGGRTLAGRHFRPPRRHVSTALVSLPSEHRGREHIGQFAGSRLGAPRAAPCSSRRRAVPPARSACHRGRG